MNRIFHKVICTYRTYFDIIFFSNFLILLMPEKFISGFNSALYASIINSIFFNLYLFAKKTLFPRHQSDELEIFLEILEINGLA